MLKFTASNLLETVTMKHAEEIWEKQDGQLCSMSLMKREDKYFWNKFEIHWESNMKIPLSLHSSNSVGVTESAACLFALPSQTAGSPPHENNCVLEKHFQEWKTRVLSLYWGILLIADSYLQISDLCIMLLPLIGESARNSFIHI